MPQAIGVVVKIAVSFLVKMGASTAFATFLAKTFVYAAGNFLLNRAINSLTKKPRGTGRGMESSYYDATASARIIFGEVMTGGMNVIPAVVTGANGEFLHQVLALAGHEIDSFTDVKFDQDTISNGNIGSVTGSASDGAVSSGKYSGKTHIRRYRGTSAQTVDYILNAADGTAFPSTFRGRGIAYAALRYKYDTATYKGIPQAQIGFKGARVYDPRLDSTNGGSGSQRYTDPTTWTWSSTPALCTAWYLMSEHGGEYPPATEIDWALVAAAANIDEALVNIPGATTQKRYTCNGILLAADEFTDNLSRLVDANFGRIVYRDGKWRVYSGAWTTPVGTISKADWLAGGLTIQCVGPRQGGRWNGVRCFYVDASRNYQRVECYPRTNATYKTDDGDERIWLEIEQPLCVNEYEAQRKAEFALRQSRNQIKIAGRLSPRFQWLQTWDTVYVDFDELGFSSKTFRITSWDLDTDGSIAVTLLEEQSSDWTDMASGDYSTPSSVAITTTEYVPKEIPAVSVNGGADSLVFTLVPPPNFINGVYYELRVHSAQSPVTSGSLVGTYSSPQFQIPRTDSNSMFYWLRALYGSQASTYTPSSLGLLGRPLTVSSAAGGFSITLNTDYLYAESTATPITSEPCIATINNGTAPFSLQWTKVSGDSIKINTAVGTQTTFTGSGMGILENRQATFRCSAVDGAAAADQKDVYVNVFREI